MAAWGAGDGDWYTGFRIAKHMDLIGHHFIVASRWQHQQAHMDVDNDI